MIMITKYIYVASINFKRTKIIIIVTISFCNVMVPPSASPRGACILKTHHRMYMWF